MIDIKILGTGCCTCMQMERAVTGALQALGMQDNPIELVTEDRLIEYGLQAEQAPGLLIEGCLAWAGSIPSQSQIVEWICQAETATII